ncbi:MAG: hypothetical protein Tsb009_21700 [Planctomycetaceae bacterium]
MMMTHWRQHRGILLVCGIVLGAAFGGLQSFSQESSIPKPLPKWKVTISRETTFFTKPVGKNGNVNYAEALNRHYSKGVIPENNAAVPLFQAFGTKEIPEKLRFEFFKKLGIKALPENGVYVTWPDFSKIPNKAERKKAEQRWHQQYDKALEGLWKKAQCPEIANWLDANRKTYSLIMQASQQPILFVPFVVDGKRQDLSTALDSRMAVYQPTRESVRILSMWANLHLGEGHADLAIKDLLAAHRLARLIHRSGFMIESLVAFALEAIASEGDGRLVASGQLTAKQTLGYLKQLEQLGPLNEFGQNYHVAERCFALDILLQIAQSEKIDPKDWEGFDLLSKGVVKALSVSFEDYFDINVVLKEMNHQIDEIVRIANIRDAKSRRKAVRLLKQKLEKFEKDSKQDPTFLKEGKLKPAERRKASIWLSRALMTLTLPTLDVCFNAQDRANSRHDFSKIILALAAYRAEHKNYPAQLTSLTLKYLKVIPLDRFTGEPLKYRRTKKGFLLYSVGANGKDDGGRYEYPGESVDDVVIRVPPKSDR